MMWAQMRMTMIVIMVISKGSQSDSFPAKYISAHNPRSLIYGKFFCLSRFFFLFSPPPPQSVLNARRVKSLIPSNNHLTCGCSRGNNREMSESVDADILARSVCADESRGRAPPLSGRGSFSEQPMVRFTLLCKK